LLTRTNRLDMVDYYNNGQVVDIANNMGGDSRMLEMDSAYLKVQTSPSRVVEMRMMTTKRDTAIAVIETVMTPVPDSRITFWNAQWQQGKIKQMPTIDEFISRSMPADLRADLRDAMIFPLIEMRFTGDKHDILEVRHGIKEFLAPSEYQRFEQYLKPSLQYRIQGLKFKPVK